MDELRGEVNIPDIPDFWPDYGTQAYAERMSTPNYITFEVFISLPELKSGKTCTVDEKWRKRISFLH